MTKVFVLDTNSLISAALLRNSTNRKVLDKVISLGIIGISKETVTELAEVLYRKKFDKYFHEENERSYILDRIENNSEKFTPNFSITVCRDPKDNKFLELAVAANASCIITGDNDLLVLNPFRKIPILNASDFLIQFQSLFSK